MERVAALTPSQAQLLREVHSLLHHRSAVPDSLFGMLMVCNHDWKDESLALVGDDDARSMHSLLKGGVPALERKLLRETFHGSFNDAFLAKYLQHPLSELFSRRQMGSDRRAQLPLLALDTERRSVIFRAAVNDALTIEPMGNAELHYVEKALNVFVGWGSPRISSKDDFAIIKRNHALQMAIRRVTCDSCQDWVNSRNQNGALVRLTDVVVLSASSSGCASNFEDGDIIESVVNSGGGDDNDDSAREAEADGEAMPALERGPHVLFVCNDCGVRIRSAQQMIGFLRTWCGEGVDLLALPMKRSEMRLLCRMAAVALMSLSDVANDVLAKPVSSVGTRIRDAPAHDRREEEQ